MFKSLLAVLAVTLILPTASHAVLITVGASKDNTLYQDAAGGLSNGTGSTFFSGETGGGLIRRGLVEFDLSAIPAGSTIQSVTLNLFLVQAQSFPTDVSLHEVLAEWGEGTSNAGVRAGGGAGATTNDATWRHTFYGGSFWTNPGGDFDLAVSATTLVGAEGSTYHWLNTPALVADVQGWLDLPVTNHGWLLQGDESQSSTAKAFGTHESSDISVRPSLTVSYSPVPEPGAFGSVIGGIGMLLLIRRKYRVIPTRH